MINLILFYFFILSFEFLFFSFNFELRQKCETCHSVVTNVIVMVTQSCDTEKIIEGSETDNIIQHSNMLVL